jgi:hypothetical protein
MLPGQDFAMSLFSFVWSFWFSAAQINSDILFRLKDTGGMVRVA